MSIITINFLKKKSVSDRIRFFFSLFIGRRGVKRHIVIAALDNAGGGNYRQLGVFLEIRNRQYTTVAHGGLHLVKALRHVVVKGTGVDNVGVNAFLEGEL